jgi:hypothetical protein
MIDTIFFYVFKALVVLLFVGSIGVCLCFFQILGLKPNIVSICAESCAGCLKRLGLIDVLKDAFGCQR